MYIPPYVWIHIKNFMLQDYWCKKKKKILLDLPKHEEAWPHLVLTTATKKPQFRKEFVKNQFDNRVTTIYSVYSS